MATIGHASSYQIVYAVTRHGLSGIDIETMDFDDLASAHIGMQTLRNYKGGFKRIIAATLSDPNDVVIDEFETV